MYYIEVAQSICCIFYPPIQRGGNGLNMYCIRCHLPASAQQNPVVIELLPRPPSGTLLTRRTSSFVMPVASTYSRPFSSLLMRMGADPNFCKICHLSLPLPCFLIACHNHVCISDFTVAVLSFLWVPFYNMGILRKCQECSTMRN